MDANWSVWVCAEINFREGLAWLDNGYYNLWLLSRQERRTLEKVEKNVFVRCAEIYASGVTMELAISRRMELKVSWKENARECLTTINKYLNSMRKKN